MNVMILCLEVGRCIPEAVFTIQSYFYMVKK